MRWPEKMAMWAITSLMPVDVVLSTHHSKHFFLRTANSGAIDKLSHELIFLEVILKLEATYSLLAPQNMILGKEGIIGIRSITSCRR